MGYEILKIISTLLAVLGFLGSFSKNKKHEAISLFLSSIGLLGLVITASVFIGRL